MPGTTTTTINREQRDGLYEVVRNHLGLTVDFFDALELDRDYVAAERLGLEFAEDFELLKDIGWAREDARAEFELTMPPLCLMELLQRLQGEAGTVLGGWTEEREDVETKERFRRAFETCEKVLADLDPRAGGRS